MKKIFMTFGADNVVELNNQIRNFAEANGYEEIDRSAPGASAYNGYFYTFVTSTFVAKKGNDEFDLETTGKKISKNEISDFILGKK